MTRPTPPDPRPLGDERSSPGVRHRNAERVPRWFAWLSLACFAGYLVFLAGRITAAAGASDSSGYLNGARLLAKGQLQTELRLPPEFGHPNVDDQKVFTPLGFVTASRTTHMIPAYATGLPLHFAIAAKVFGWELGPRMVEWLAAATAVWLCYLIARQVGLSAPLAVAGAVALAVCPIFLFTSIQALSDTLATTWSLAAFYGGLRARHSDRWALACGFALSVAVLVRMTNVFLTPALVVLLGLSWRRLLRFAVAGLPGAAWLAFYNQHQFGGVLATGYGSVGADFSLGNGVPTLIHFARWLGLLLPGILLVLPVAAVASRATRGRELLASALAFGAIAGFYLFYDISQQVWWCLRYILPVVPFLILAGLMGVEALARGPAANWRRFRATAAFVIAGWALIGSWYWTNALHVLLVQHYEQTYADASRAASERLPPNALVIANNFSGALYFYTEFPVLRADVVVADDFERYAAIARNAGRPICAVLFDFEEQEALRERCPGNWTRLSTHANVGFWRLEPGGRNW